MAQIYYKLIKLGLKEIEQVPDVLKSEVEVLLAADNV